jgi:hypothetical protein
MFQSPSIKQIPFRNTVINTANAALSAGLLLWFPQDRTWNCNSYKTTAYIKTPDRHHAYMKLTIQTGVRLFFDTDVSQYEAQHWYCVIKFSIPVYFSLLSLLMRSPFCVSVYPPHQVLKAWTNHYETWCVYHGTWAHLNGVLHKTLPPVCVSPYRC